MQKPHRFVLDRVASYAEEGAAFLRRRRLRGRPFARIWRAGGAIEARDADSAEGRELFSAAAGLLSEQRRH